MEIGNVLRPTDRAVNEHPFVVVSLPQNDPDEVVLVNFTSYEAFFKDSSCILDRGDHPWIVKKTCRDAILAQEADLDRLLGRGLLTRLEDATDALLGKILAGAEKTEELPGKCRRVLERQGLIGT